MKEWRLELCELLYLCEYIAKLHSLSSDDFPFFF